jgi:hypothetical protein
VLLPLVAKMDAPPAPAAEVKQAVMLAAGSSGWAPAEQWAMAPAQRAVIDALDKVTREERPDEAMAFGQPYGADAVGASASGADLIKANLYTDLGDPPMLAGAKFLYLDGLERVMCLVNVEATRLAAAGQMDKAMDVLTDWLFFSRQMADRQMVGESTWGVASMLVSFERIMDVAYVDFRAGKKALTPDQILAEIDRIRDQNGFLRMDRIKFPAANRIAAEQTVAMVFDKNGPSPAFGQTMARLASTHRPLRLFAEAARWDAIATKHASAADTRDELQKVYDDLAGRWPLDPFDPRMDAKTDLERMDREQFAVLAAVTPDIPSLFHIRRLVRTYAIGTRDSLGILAFYDASKNFPPVIESIRPRFVKTIEADPFNGDRARGKQPPLQYFVPIRDETFPSGTEPHPHEMTVSDKKGSFQVKIGSDQFILYSVGPNGDRDWATEVTAFPAPNEQGDFLIWPPGFSLERQRDAGGNP